MAYWIDTGSTARLAIMPMPQGGSRLDNDIRTLKREGVQVLVSLLPPDEAADFGLQHEEAACSARGIKFRSFPIPDRRVPDSSQAFLRFIDTLHYDLLQGRSIAAHCRAGIGRSALLLAALLRREGLTPDDAFRRISYARGLQTPDTPEQLRWVEDLRLDP